MKLIDWKDRQPGDIGLVQSPGFIPRLIIDFERELHPDYTGSFWPSHAFIYTFGDMVIESILDLHENSVAAINPASKYDGLPVHIWRIQRTEQQIRDAIREHCSKYSEHGYGVLDLLGFADEAIRRAHGDTRASLVILAGYVCSMAAMDFLAQHPSGETWPQGIIITQCDPLMLEILCGLNQDGTERKEINSA
jgi:hypothetical protein